MKVTPETINHTKTMENITFMGHINSTKKQIRIFKSSEFY